MKSLYYFLFALLPVMTYSQDSIQTQDPAAEPYLDKIAEYFRTDEPYQVEFRYEIYSAMNEATVSDYGSIIIKDNKYKLKTEDTEVIYNGENLWVYHVQAGEVYKSQPEEGDTDQMLADPFRLLGNYREYYKYVNKGDKNIAGKIYLQIDLYPANLEAGYSFLRILCTEKGAEIHSIMLKQKNGTEITAYLNDIIRNINIPESTFTWDKESHPDILVIEM